MYSYGFLLAQGLLVNYKKQKKETDHIGDAAGTKSQGESHRDSGKHDHFGVLSAELLHHLAGRPYPG